MRLGWLLLMVGCTAETVSVLDLDHDVGAVSLDIRHGQVEALVDQHRIGLDTVSWGRPIQMQDAQATSPRTTPTGASVAADGIETWFRRVDEGVQQGFTVHSAPVGDGPLAVTVQLDTDLYAEQIASDHITLSNSDGQTVASYRGLVAWDANGVDLDADMSLFCATATDCRVDIQVWDDHAVYPVTIDPVIVNELHDIDGLALLGTPRSLSMQGGRLAVGSTGGINGQGKAQMFTYNPFSGFTPGQIYEPPLDISGQNFGASVYLTPFSDLLVGAPSGGFLNPGRLYVFDGPGPSPAGTPIVQNGNGTFAYLGRCGNRITGDPDMGLQVAVGCSGMRPGGASTFDSGGAGFWPSVPSSFYTNSSRLINPTNAPYQQFGHSIALGNSTFAASARTPTGTVYLYFTTALTDYPDPNTPRTVLQPVELVTDAGFGEGLVYGNGRLAVAAPNQDGGSVYVYDVLAGEAFLEQKITIGIGSNAQCGRAMAIDQDTLAIACPRSDTTAFRGGEIYVYQNLTGNNWEHVNTLQLSDAVGSDALGTAVAISGERVIAVAPGRGMADGLFDFEIDRPDLGPVVDNCPDNDEKLEPEVCGCEWYDRPALSVAGVADEGMACVHITATEGTGIDYKNGARVHPYAHMGNDTALGYNSQVFHRARVEDSASVGDETIIGRLAVLQTAASVADDCVVNREATLGSSATVGSSSAIGYRASIAANAQLGEFSILGPLVNVTGASTIGMDASSTLTVLSRGVVLSGVVDVRDGVVVGPDVTIGTGSVLHAGSRLRKNGTLMDSVTIGAGARIGRGITLQTGAAIGSDTILGPHTTVESNVCVDSGLRIARNTLVQLSSCNY